MTLKVCFINDLGAHTTEAMQVIDAFENYSIFFILPHKEVDRDMILSFENVYALRERKFMIKMPTVSFLRIFLILLKERPQVILSTGSIIAIPAFFFGKILGAKLIFIECAAQVTAPSGTGKILYWLSDLFFVQWNTLLKHYGKKARYVGGLI